MGQVSNGYKREMRISWEKQAQKPQPLSRLMDCASSKGHAGLSNGIKQTKRDFDDLNYVDDSSTGNERKKKKSNL